MTSDKKIRQNTIDALIKKQKSNDINIIDKYIKTYIDKADQRLMELTRISLIENNDIKEEEFNKIEKEIKQDTERVEYLISPDISVYNEYESINILRHKYYLIQDNRSAIKSDIVFHKTQCHEDIMRISEEKLGILETKFEGIGGTILSIVVSVSIINAAIVGIDKIDSKYIPLFIISIVWFGMTYLLFTNCMFKRDKKNNRNAMALYSVISIITIILLLIAFRKNVVEVFKFFF